MARELVWTGFMTLDGAVDSPGGAAEGHPEGGWVFQTPFDADSYSLKGEEIGETTALMFGKRSYEAFSAFWPTSEDHAAYYDLPKYVVSSSITDDDIVSDWGGTTVLRSTDDVAALKDTDGGAIFIHGSAELARRLGAAGLIDRYNLLIFPFLLPDAKSVFPQADGGRRTLALRESASYPNGVAKAIYEVRA
jgi:dihydrofolate reductase